MVDIDGGDFVLEEIGDVPLRYLSVGDLYESFTDDDLQVAINYLINHPRHRNTTTLDILSNNSRITRIPEEISNLKKLKILEITGHENLRQLPASLNELPNLEKLNVSENDLRSLPVSFYPKPSENKLTKLKKINISGNQNFHQIVPIPNIINSGVEVTLEDTLIEGEFDEEVVMGGTLQSKNKRKHGSNKIRRQSIKKQRKTKKSKRKTLRKR
jgi:hypothetical protein